MLQRIRDGLQSQKWLTYVVLGALILVFAVWGAYGIVDLSLGPANYAAKADGEKISLRQVQEAWQRRQMMWQQRFGGELPAELKSRMQDELLEAMVNDVLLSKHAHDLGYRISNEQVHEQVRQIPQFQVDGQFNADAARYALTADGTSEQEFETSLRRGLERRQIEEAIGISNFLTPTEQKRLHALQSEQREVRYATLPPEKYAAEAPVGDAAVDAYYTANQSRYMTPETVHLAYAELRLDQLASQVVITDSDLAEGYEKHKASYTKPERRQARHILIESGDDDAAAKKKAQDVAAQAKGGADFGELAKKYSQDTGSAQKGGDLGWSERGYFDPAFEDAEFSMKVGEVRGPVKSKFGYHIIKLEGIEPGQTRGLDEVRGELEAELRRERAADRFGDAMESLQDRVEQPGADFDTLVKEFSLQTGDVPDYQRGKGGDSLSATPELDEVVFSSAVLDDRKIGGPVALSEDRIVVVKALDHHKPEPRPLADVREEIVKSIREEYGRTQAAAVAEEAREKLAGGATFDEVAKSLKVSPDPAKFIGRDDPSVPAAIRTATFDSAKPPVGSSIYRIVNLDNGGAAVLAISGVRMDPNSTPTLQVAEQRQAVGRQGQADAAAYLDELRRTADVSKNPKAFE